MVQIVKGHGGRIGYVMGEGEIDGHRHVKVEWQDYEREVVHTASVKNVTPEMLTHWAYATMRDAAFTLSRLGIDNPFDVILGAVPKLEELKLTLEKEKAREN